MKNLLGIKREMTQVFDANGAMVPVTVVDIAGNAVIGTRTNDKDRYEAVILGLGKKKKPSKAELGKYKELGYVPEFIREVDAVEIALGEVDLSADLTGKKVSVTGITKGKGFQGGMKRWGFSGTKQTHGQSDRMRAPGSIGSGTTPGRVYKGKKMAGRMGSDRQTVKNLVVVKHLVEEKLLLVKGAIPGAKGNKIIINFID
jgi:large subunit ribosomal protein L3